MFTVMNKNITEAKVWRKFKKAVEKDGFLFVEVTTNFKETVYKSFISEYEKCPLTVESFAKDFMVHFRTIPMRSIDNTQSMRSSS
jgi:hypothetical protein